MPQGYKPRQSLYLRISANAVLQMTLCLDERHCGWMSEAVMERILNALKDRIGPKLRKEAKEGKDKVDVYRGAGWQMAYFYRKSSSRHAVLLKSKHLEQPELSDHSAPPVASTSSPNKHRKATETTSNTAQLDGTSLEEDPFDLDIGHSPEPTAQDPAPLPGVRVKAEIDEEAEQAALFAAPPELPPSNPPAQSDPQQPEPLADPEDLEEKDVKPDIKPKLRVSYKGFSIFGRTLVVVVEPYPPLTQDQIRQSIAIASASAEPATFTQRNQLSATPLPASITNANRKSSRASRPPVPLFRPSISASPAPTSAAERQDENLDRFRARSQSLVLDLDDDEADQPLPPLPSQLETRKRSISRVQEEPEE